MAPADGPAVISAPYSGSWSLSPAGSPRATATPTRTADGTTAVRLASAPSVAAVDGQPPAPGPATLTLKGTANPFWVYGFRFDFLRDPAHFSAGAFTACNDIWWGLGFLAGSDTVQVTNRAAGKTSVAAKGDLTFGGKYKAAQTWYRVEVRNTPSHVQCRVTVRKAPHPSQSQHNVESYNDVHGAWLRQWFERPCVCPDIAPLQPL